MRSFTVVPALLAVTALAVGLSCTEADQLTDPLAPEISGPSFDMGGQGEGAVFTTNPFAVLGVLDQTSGDLCIATLDPPVDDFSDFLVTYPTGRQVVHIANHDVMIEITLASGEAAFSGSGTAHAQADVTVDGLKAQSAEILGEVSNGTVTKQAFCKFIRSAFGTTVHFVREVRLW